MPIDVSREARDVAMTLEVKSPNIAEHIFLNNGILSLMSVNKRVKVSVGGNRFDERVHLGDNSNTAFRDKHAQIPTAFQDNWRTAEYGHAVISGAAPINFVEEDQNAGKSRLSVLADETLAELKNTFANVVANALMAATSGAKDPLSIKEELPATAHGSQSRVTGGIPRASFPGTDPTRDWQTQFNSTAADLAAAAGLKTFHKFLYTCSPGGSAVMEMPDIGITTNGVLASLSGNGDNLRRYEVNDRMLKLGFNNFLVGSATFISDRNAATGTVYLLNTNYLGVRILAGRNPQQSGEVQVIGDGKVDVPVNIRPPVESGDYLNYVIKAYLVMNLVFRGLRNHGLKTGVSEG